LATLLLLLLLFAGQLSQELSQVVQGMQQLEFIKPHLTLAGLGQAQHFPVGSYSLRVLLGQPQQSCQAVECSCQLPL
jgi:hypothetical protein